MKKLIFILSVAILSCNSKSNSSANEDFDISLDTIIVDTANVGQKGETVSKKNEIKVKELAQYFRVKKDEFESVEWITPKSAPVYTNYDALYCYFAFESDYATNFRFRLQYVDEDWLFIENAKFLVDGKIFNYYPNEVKRDNDSDIWEWWDENVSINDLEMLRAISTSKNAKIKLNGSQYYKVVEITEKQKLNIGRTLDYYEALGGTFH